MNKILLSIFFLLLACAACLGQSSYKGLTPGKSTRAEAERVLGKPQRAISPTLAEYSGGSDANKIYVQFADESPAAEALRIELMCETGEAAKDSRYGCKKLYDLLVPKPDSFTTSRYTDARTWRKSDAQWSQNYTLYHGAPAFVVCKFRQNATGESLAQWYIGLYSRELYENTVPKSCTGTFAGVWETNRGRMTISRTSEYPTPSKIRVKGEYSPNGTVSGATYADDLDGEWTDSTGRGTMSLRLNEALEDHYAGFSFTGTWERTSGKGPKKGTWEGRCVEAKVAGND